MSDPGAWPESPSKRALERAWLLYTPVWGAALGLIMVTGLAESWGDAPLLALGVVLALGTYAAAWVAMPEAERGVSFFERTAVKASLGVTLLAFGLNYFQTPFFFDVLHMRYGFRATWVIERNPIFLYLVTVPYFATYSVLGCLGVRTVRRLTSRRSLRAVGIAAIPCALALLETALNANPFMTRLFCYGEPVMMLTFGSAAYGLSLGLALPGWLWLDERLERDGVRTALLAVVGWVALAVAVDAAVLAVVRRTVAPLVTTVEDPTAPGWDAQGCLRGPT